MVGKLGDAEKCAQLEGAKAALLSSSQQVRPAASGLACSWQDACMVAADAACMFSGQQRSQINCLASAVSCVNSERDPQCSVWTACLADPASVICTQSGMRS